MPPDPNSPPASGAAQVDPPERIDAIAGTVFRFSVPEVDDYDTVSGEVVADRTWRYGSTGEGTEPFDPASVLESNDGSNGEPPYWILRMPATQAVISLAMNAEDVGDSIYHDATTWADWQYEIHVHELAVAKLWTGCAMENNAQHPVAGQSGSMHSFDCDWWDDADTFIPMLKYSTDPADEVDGRILYYGQCSASSDVVLKSVDGYVGPVVPVLLSFRHTMPCEAMDFVSGSVTISALTAAVRLTSETALDPVVSFDEEVDWQWEYTCLTPDPQTGQPYSTASIEIDPPDVEWIASTHDSPVLFDQKTVKRIESVCRRLNGNGTHEHLCLAAADWAADNDGAGGDGGVLTFGDGWPREIVGDNEYLLSTEDVWCLICRGYGDCQCGARLAAAALKLVGVGAISAEAYPQQCWSPDGIIGWTVPDSCFAMNTPPGTPHPYWDDHAGNPVIYVNSLGAGNNYEGFFTASEWEDTGPFFTAFPELHKNTLFDVIDDRAAYYACVGVDEDDDPFWFRDGYTVGNPPDEHTHELPKPTTGAP